MARAAATFGGFVFLMFCLGCMNLNFGGKSEVVGTQDSEITQKGKAFVRGGDDVCVYYPTPFQYPPNLELVDQASKQSVQITDQRADHFRVKNTGTSGLNLSWEARGVKVAPNSVPVAVSGASSNGAVPANETVPRAVRNP